MNFKYFAWVNLDIDIDNFVFWLQNLRGPDPFGVRQHFAVVELSELPVDGLRGEPVSFPPRVGIALSAPMEIWRNDDQIIHGLWMVGGCFVDLDCLDLEEPETVEEMESCALSGYTQIRHLYPSEPEWWEEQSLAVQIPRAWPARIRRPRCKRMPRAGRRKVLRLRGTRESRYTIPSPWYRMIEWDITQPINVVSKGEHRQRIEIKISCRDWVIPQCERLLAAIRRLDPQAEVDQHRGASGWHVLATPPAIKVMPVVAQVEGTQGGRPKIGAHDWAFGKETAGVKRRYFRQEWENRYVAEKLEGMDDMDDKERSGAEALVRGRNLESILDSALYNRRKSSQAKI